MIDNIYLVFIDADSNDEAKTVCEALNGKSFDNEDDLIQGLREANIEEDSVVWYSVFDFVHLCNNQELDNLTNDFIASVTIGR